MQASTCPGKQYFFPGIYIFTGVLLFTDTRELNGRMDFFPPPHSSFQHAYATLVPGLPQ